MSGYFTVLSFKIFCLVEFVFSSWVATLLIYLLIDTIVLSVQLTLSSSENRIPCVLREYSSSPIATM